MNAAPLAPYIGGKRNLAGRLAKIIDGAPHRIYAEPFVGMGGVFFRRRRPAPREVINDLSRDVSNLFRVVQRHHGPLLELLRYQLTCRDEYDRQEATDPETLTDIERAARFLLLQRMAFGGKVKGRNFGMGSTVPGGGWDKLRQPELAAIIDLVHERLARVIIERRPFEAFLAHYDSPDTLFYLDPPYWGTEHVYGPGMFARADFEILRDCLRGLRGRFILSINDAPPVRALFAEFAIDAVETTYGLLASGQKTGVGELVITGR